MSEQRIAELFERLAKLEGERPEEWEGRLNRNAERYSAALRAAQPDAMVMQRNTLTSELRPLHQRRDVLLRLVGEVNALIAEHRATPKPTHGAEEALWVRKDEELVETLYEINQGKDLSGYFAKLAKRDGIPLEPGLIATKSAIARLEGELAALAS